MKSIMWFREIKKEDIPFVGGKGANLGEMISEAFPVPQGFVVTAQAYFKFIEEKGIKSEIVRKIDAIEVEKTAELEKVSAEIRELILRTPMNRMLETEIRDSYSKMNERRIAFISTREEEFVAVRSSATAEDLPEASFAGQQETFLNVKGRNDVVEAVKKCWASLFTARAVYYRKKQNFETDKVGIAVVIQKMVESEVAGILFTAEPTGDTTKIIIEAGYGLGEAVVSGSITPDTYTIEKATFKIIEKKISKQEWSIERAETGNEKRDVSKTKQMKQKLEDKYIVQLAKIGRQIENHYKKPMDIEWALENKQLFIVQARPITTLGMKEKTEKEKGRMIATKEKPIAVGLSASPGIASAKAVIIPDAKDADKVKQGDIIVTKMTNPDWVPIMEKAKAIVTEEGGRTCFTGDTVLLTNKGFTKFEDVFKSGESLYVPSLNRETLKIEWKRILATMKRRGEVIEIETSQTGRMNGNKLRLTKDHKMIIFNKRKLIEKEIQDVIADKNMLTIMQNLPCLQQSSEKDKKMAYLLGAISTDGHIYLTDRHGEVQFIQKPTIEKESFIKAVHECMESVFGKIFSTQKKKTSSGSIRGKEVIGNANAYRCYSKQIATEMKMYKSQIVETILQADEEFILNYLAGIIDGDGSFQHGRINIYCSTKELLQSIVLSCLRLGFVPQTTINRTIYNVQIVEKVEKILNYTNRVKGTDKRKTNGTRFFSAKQLLEDVAENINYRGKIKPYIKSNLLIDADKIKQAVLPMCNKNLKEELEKILGSDIRMQRTGFAKNLGETDVFNISVEDNHNYVVFTERLTPIIVNNCHAAIVSRELGIPCVVGAINAMKNITEGELITVDGFNGLVYKGRIELEAPEEIEEKVFEDKKEVEEVKEELEEEGEKFAAKEKDGKLIQHLEKLLEERAIKVKVNVALPEAAEKAAQTGADGVGLLRAEHMITESGMHPAEFLREGKEEQLIEAVKNGIKKVASLFKGKPVWYRTFDARSDEFRNLKGGEKEPKEENPMIGWHGIRRSLDEPKLIQAEFKAIKELVEEGYNKLGVMLPFVISASEVKKAKELAIEVGLKPRKDVQFGVMIETPAAVWAIDELIEEGIDFISFGTNDLTQLTLGVDRNNEHIQKLFSEMHPAVLRSC
ncbi:MAG: PEP/pyruvate-binding domain-containing protein, partial [archaeon]